MAKRINEHKLLLFIAEHISKKTRITQNELALFLEMHLNTLRKNKELLKTIQEINQKYLSQQKNTENISSSPKKRKSSTRFRRNVEKKYRLTQIGREFCLIRQDHTEDILCQLFDGFFEYLAQTKSNRTETLKQYAKSLTKCLNQISINRSFGLECENDLTPKSNNEKTVWKLFFFWVRENYENIRYEREKGVITAIADYYNDFGLS